jgi:hypothetical protein
MKSNGYLAPAGSALRPITYEMKNGIGCGFCGTQGLAAGQRAGLALEDGRDVVITIDAIDEEIGSIEFHSAASTC